jgi:hypothetical protein
VKILEDYAAKCGCKFLGAGLSEDLVKLSAGLCPRLWKDLDIVPLVSRTGMDYHSNGNGEHAASVEAEVNEDADSVVRKCLMCETDSM